MHQHRHVRKLGDDFYGPQSQILGRCQKMYLQNFVPLPSLLLKFRGFGFGRSNFGQGQEQNHKNHRRTLRAVGMSGFSLGLMGFLCNREKLTSQEEDELVCKLKAGILAILECKSEEAEKLLEQVWEMTDDLKGTSEIRQLSIDLDVVDRLFTISHLASEKMELNVDEACFLEICTKLGNMLELPMTDRMREGLRLAFQCYAGTQYEKIKEAKKNKNGLQLVAIYFEILSQAATIMSTTIEREDQPCIKSDDKDPCPDETAPSFLEILAEGVISMVADTEEDCDVDDDTVDTLAKEEYGQEDETPTPC